MVDDILEIEQALQTMRNCSPYRSERDRANILLTFARSGLSQRGVGLATGHAPSHVNETLKRFRLDGIDSLRERRGGGNRLPRRDEIIALLPTLVAGVPGDFGWNRSTWSVELVMLEIQRQLGVKISRPHVGRMLAEAGCRRVRPKPTIALTPADHAEQIAELNTALERVPAADVVLYADEIDIHLNPKSGPDWMPKGVRKELVTPGKNCKQYIAGAYDPQTGGLVTTAGPSKCSALFIALLQLLAEVYADAGTIHVVLDNFIIHKSKKTKAAIDKLGSKVELHFLPPYCPQYNPIERVWWDVHAHVTRNHRHPNIEDLMDAVQRYVQDYDELAVDAAACSRAQA